LALSPSAQQVIKRSSKYKWLLATNRALLAIFANLIISIIKRRKAHPEDE